MPSALLIAAPHSGAGKTTLTLALLAALRRRGLTVQAFKVGPDYIDPAHHARITGRPSHNLDTWMLPADANRALYQRAAAGADAVVVEGVMGLFDGVDGRRPDGSSAHLAQLLDLPVVLVVDARSAARSAAAVVHGFTTFDPRVRLAGVIWNRVGSANHRRILDEALEAAHLPPSLGAVPRDATVAIPERHLGLVTPGDAPGAAGDAALARLAEENLDLDTLLQATRREPFSPLPDPSQDQPARVRVAVARDSAFCFYYEENLDLLQRHGAQLLPFRPVDGDGIPPRVDALYLGGGYPEVHAERLSRNTAFLDGVRALHARAAPIYAECGGFMTLCRSLETDAGVHHPMAGIYPGRTRMSGRAFRLGYREIRVQDGSSLAGLSARGHEFHYSHLESMPDAVERAYAVRNARGETLEPEGYRLGNTLAGYLHLHFGSNPEFPRRLFRLPGPGGSDSPH